MMSLERKTNASDRRYLLQQILTVWNALSVRRRIMVIGASLAMFAAVLAMSRMAAAPNMVLLYSGLEFRCRRRSRERARAARCAIRRPRRIDLRAIGREELAAHDAGQRGPAGERQQGVRTARYPDRLRHDLADVRRSLLAREGRRTGAHDRVEPADHARPRPYREQQRQSVPARRDARRIHFGDDDRKRAERGTGACAEIPRILGRPGTRSGERGRYRRQGRAHRDRRRNRLRQRR